MRAEQENAVAVEAATSPTAEVRALIGALDEALSAHYAAEQRHSLSLDGLFQPHIRFFLARLDGVAVGCGGVALFPEFAEVKRMFVMEAMRGRGVAQALIRRVEAEARAAGVQWLRLETGDRQLAAMRMYERAGFARCGAFGAYAAMTASATATSVFMQKDLSLPPR